MRPLPILATLSLAAALGCTPNNPSPSPEQIRSDAAKATSTAAQDIKAAAEGVRDGLHHTADEKAVVNINTADRPTLETLPGITPVLSGRIVAHRPFKDPSDLVKKRILTQTQYDSISARLTTFN